MATIFRTAQVTPATKLPARIPPFDAPNILLSVLVATTPFFPQQIPPPQAPKYSQHQFEPANILLSTLVPVSISAPFTPTAWPNTYKLPKTAPFETPNLLLTTFVATTPFFEPQWYLANPPLPKAKPFDPPNLIIAELVATLPFQAYIMGGAWPNPYKASPRAVPFDSPFPFQTLPPPPARVRKAFYPPVVAFLPDSREHRRQIVEAVNAIRAGKQNVTHDLTLTPGVTQTTLTDARIGVSTAVSPSMALTANGAAAIVAGIYVTHIKTGSAVINHANSAALDQTIRFTLIG